MAASPLGRTATAARRAAPGVVCIVFLITVLAPVRPAAAVDELIVGEALYMSGNLGEAARRLSAAARSEKPAHAARALYLLGRINLFQGDFRQAKEFFERAAEAHGRGTSGRWMALAGIGDTLYASGRCEEAIRRYRVAQGEAAGDSQDAVIDLRIALCEHSLGRESEARNDLRRALSKIPVLSGWVGREEEFYHSMAMVGVHPTDQNENKIYVEAGPLEGDFRVDELVGPEVAIREVRRKGRSYLLFGPLTDPVEGMILVERIRSSTTVPAEVVSR